MAPSCPWSPWTRRRQPSPSSTERDKPLALYVFSEDAGVREAFTEQTSSGALDFGVPAAHLFVPGLPFGGVGESGMGSYHGRHSIDTFSHRKAILDKPLVPGHPGADLPALWRHQEADHQALRGAGQEVPKRLGLG